MSDPLTQELAVKKTTMNRYWSFAAIFFMGGLLGALVMLGILTGQRIGDMRAPVEKPALVPSLSPLSGEPLLAPIAYSPPDDSPAFTLEVSTEHPGSALKAAIPQVAAMQSAAKSFRVNVTVTPLPPLPEEAPK